MTYTVVLGWDAEDGTYNVSVPVLPGCYTWGRTEAEALANVREAILGYLEALTDAGDPIPEETGLRRVRV